MTDHPGLPEAFPWHRENWDRLVRRRIEACFPHALLLVGHEGLGKRAFAGRLAAALNCEASHETAPCGRCRSCRNAAVDAHPEIVRVMPEETGLIRIEAVRDLIERMQLACLDSRTRVAVIEEAERLTAPAANALLKTLEEPTSGSCLLLVSSRPQRLPATIRSRCQQLAFPIPPRAQALAWLEGRLDDPAGAEAALAAAGGAPLSALRLATGERMQWLLDTGRAFLRLAQRRGDPLAVAADWAAHGVETGMAGLRRVLFDVARLAQGGARPAGRLYLPALGDELQKVAGHINLRELHRMLDELARLESEAVAHHLDPVRVMDKLVNDWLSITRPEKR